MVQIISVQVSGWLSIVMNIMMNLDSAALHCSKFRLYSKFGYHNLVVN